MTLEEAASLVNNVISINDTPDWISKIAWARTNGSVARFHHTRVLRSDPRISTAIDYRFPAEVDLERGLLTVIDLPKAPPRPVGAGEIDIRYSYENLRARTLQAYAGWQPFPRGKIADEGLVFRVPSFQAFDRVWMTPRHVEAASQRRRIAMFQMNISTRRYMQYLYLDAATGEPIAIRLMDWMSVYSTPRKDSDPPATASAEEWSLLPPIHGKPGGVRILVAKSGHVVVGAFRTPNVLHVSTRSGNFTMVLDPALARQFAPPPKPAAVPTIRMGPPSRS